MIFAMRDSESLHSTMAAASAAWDKHHGKGIMKLTDLEPRWLTPDLFIFRSPTGCKDWLSCKRAPVPRQNKLFYELCPDLIGQTIVGTKSEVCWTFEAGGDFSTLTVKPSIDASASGNWHGFITNGEIV